MTHDVDAIARPWMDTVRRLPRAIRPPAATPQTTVRAAVREPADTTYVRQPATIDAYAPWALSERGEWSGR
jgi:hypothetical protein